MLDKEIGDGQFRQETALQDRAQVEFDITSLQTSKKRVQKQLNSINLKIDKSMKEYKKLENDNAAIVSYNKEQTTKVEVMQKLADEKKKQIKQLKKDTEKLVEEQHISVGQLVKKGMEEKNMTAKGINLKEKIMKLQNNVTEI